MANNITYPYDDEDMIYDYAAHRYVLTQSGVAAQLGIVLQTTIQRTPIDSNPSLAGERFLNFISRHLYGYIYRNIPTANRNVIEYVLAKCPEVRGIVKQAMLNEVEYVLSEGAFWNKSGINILKGAAMDLSTLRDTRVISYDTEALLYSPIPSLPYPLLYRGVIPTLNNEWRTDY